MKIDTNEDTKNAGSNREDATEKNNISSLDKNSGGGTGTSVQRAKEAVSEQDQDDTQGAGSNLKRPAQVLLDKAKDTAGQAYEMATEKAASKLDEHKADLTNGLSSVADSIKQTGESLRETDEQSAITEATAKYGDLLADRLERVSEYFEQKDLRAIASDVEGFARKNPALFIGGAFVLGILAARFLKSSSSSGDGESAGGGAAKKGGKAAGNNIVDFDSGESSNKNASSTSDSAGNVI